MQLCMWEAPVVKNGRQDRFRFLAEGRKRAGEVADMMSKEPMFIAALGEMDTSDIKFVGYYDDMEG